MAGELIASLSSSDWVREQAVGYDNANFRAIVPGAPADPETASGNMVGISFQKSYQTLALNAAKNPIQDYYQAICEIPNNLSVATGVTFRFRATDDGSDAGDLGKNAVFGLTVFNMDAGTFYAGLNAAGGTEQTTTVTLSSNSGQLVLGSIAVANAQLSNAANGNMIVLRLRRIGTNNSDTCNGRIVLLGAHLKNT
jgi:hypothetical protein